MKKLLILALTVLYLTNPVVAQETKLQDVTILVSSYDKYSNLWPTFFGLLFEQWPSLNSYNKDIPIILVSNTKTYPDARVTTIQSPYERKWTGNISDSLKQVKTKYVLYIQEDYFITEQIMESKLSEILCAMNENKLHYVEISPRLAPGNEKIPNTNSLTYNNSNSFSLQASLWDKNTLVELTNIKSANIWDFENKSIEPHHNFAYYSAKRQPIEYENLMNRGHIDLPAYTRLYVKGCNLDFADNYKIHPKHKFFNTELEWYRREMPTLTHVAFDFYGIFYNAGKKIIRTLRQVQDSL